MRNYKYEEIITTVIALLQASLPLVKAVALALEKGGEQ